MKYALWALVFTMAFSLSQPSAEAAEGVKQEQTITRSESRETVRGSDQFFTGDVTITPLFGPKHPDAPFSGGLVNFTAGARSFWHTHPTGQHLVVMEGVGRTGVWGGKVEEFKTGDVLWCPAGVKHWHGAAPDSGMTHMALTGTLPDGNNVEWMEPVTDEQYNAR